MATFDFRLSNNYAGNSGDTDALIESNGSMIWNGTLTVSSDGANNFVFGYENSFGQQQMMEATGWSDVPVSAAVTGDVAIITLGDGTKLIGTYSNEPYSWNLNTYPISFTGLSNATPKLDAPTISSVERGAGKFYVFFSGVTNGRTYTLEWGTDSTFATKNTENKYTSGADVGSGLAAGTTYYFRLKADGYTDGATYLSSAWTAAQNAVSSATCVVSNANDSGAGSLNWAISKGTSGTITFDTSLAGETIVLSGNRNVGTIDGSGLSPRVTLSMPAVTGASYNSVGDTNNSPRGVFIGVNISGTASNSRLTDCEIVSSTVALHLSYATNCVIHNSDVGLYVGAGGYTVKQCLFYKNKTDIFTATGTSGTRAASWLYSCTFANRTSNDYISPNYSDFYFINCISSKPFYEGSAYNTVNSIGITDTAGAGNTLFTSLASNFVNASANNYALKSGSQAIGGGNDSKCNWDVDIAGNKRKQGVIDVGAYEYQPVTQLTKPTASVFRPSTATAQVVLSSYDEHLSGYWIEYADNAAFSNAKTVKQEDASIALYTLSGLQNNVYYWRVMLAGDGVNYADSEWSDTVVTRKQIDAPSISKASNTDTSVVIEVKDKNVNATGWKMQYRENTLSSSFGTAVDVTLDGNSC